MAEELNHKCIICDTDYHCCNDCGNMKSFTPWRTICDTTEHYQIFMVLYELDNNFISKEEASDQLESIGITPENILHLKQSVQDVIMDIFANSKNIQDVASMTKDEKSISKKQEK
ncbi:MAG: hypothetical protein RR806_03135 [Oscillospiraceae bacterium]